MIAAAAAGRLAAAALFGVLAGCGSPTFVDRGRGEALGLPGFGEVVFELHREYRERPPDCVAVLPFTTTPEGASRADVAVDQAESVRRAFYAHLAPQGKRDVELARIDFVLGRMGAGARPDLGAVAASLRCDALVTGGITEYGSQFLGVYSRVAVGAELRMVRGSDGALLWEGRHVAASHGGNLPLSPIGIAMGILQAASNLREEQIFRVIDDLARRLVSTIPDDRIAVLDDPVETAAPTPAVRPSRPPANAPEFLAGLLGRPAPEQKAAILAAIAERRFDEAGRDQLYRAAIVLDPTDAAIQGRYAAYLFGRGDHRGALEQADRALALDDRDHAVHFLRARLLLKEGQLDAADAAIVKAIALDGSRADYFNGLGYVNSLRGDHDRALAAYKMALQRDSANGFAYYNIGVTLYNLGDRDEAADAFYGAGLAYLKAGNYGLVTKVLGDLRELAAAGVDVQDAIATLERALEKLTKEELRHA